MLTPGLTARTCRLQVGGGDRTSSLAPSGNARPGAKMRCVVHVANVAWPTPGLCFRMVQDPKRGGYPMRCPTPPRWHGVFVTPRGERWAVDACDEHAQDLDQLRPAGWFVSPSPCVPSLWRRRPVVPPPLSRCAGGGREGERHPRPGTRKRATAPQERRPEPGALRARGERKERNRRGQPSQPATRAKAPEAPST
jgi:hypothetical protein